MGDDYTSSFCQYIYKQLEIGRWTSRHMASEPKSKEHLGGFKDLWTIQQSCTYHHISTKDADRHTLEIHQKKTPISGHLTGLMISFTWHDAEKNRNPSLPPLSVLPFMTHDKAGDLLKSSRGEREVWKNGSKSHLWNSVRSGLLTTPRFRITYAITSLSTNCMETHLCVGEQFPSVLSILKSKSGLRDKNGRKDSCCRVALAIQNIMGRVVHWHPMLNYQQLGELQGPCYILSLVQNALIWWNNEWGNVEVPHGLHTINRSLIKVRT